MRNYCDDPLILVWEEMRSDGTWIRSKRQNHPRTYALYKICCINQRQFRLRVGEFILEDFRPSLPQNSVITTQPTNACGVIGKTTTFSIGVIYGATIQWQINTGAGWTNIPNETNVSLIVPVQLSTISYGYRAAVMYNSNTTFSNVVMITSYVGITQQPTLSGCSYTAGATSNVPITYSWQSSIDNGTSWQTILGQNSAIYNFTNQYLQCGSLIRMAAQISCATAYSDSIGASANIYPQPTYNLSATFGTPATGTGFVSTTANVNLGEWLFQNNPGSTCDMPKPFPGQATIDSICYDEYVFTQGCTSSCVQIDFNASGQINAMSVIAFLNTYSQNNLSIGYLADPGANVLNPFSAIVPAGSRLIVVISYYLCFDSFDYTLQVSGLTASPGCIV